MDDENVGTRPDGHRLPCGAMLFTITAIPEVVVFQRLRLREAIKARVKAYGSIKGDEDVNKIKSKIGCCNSCES